ncbi:hypothetical protein PTSG_03019 [Salpingoeca rosetta]|uniref:Amylopullulanase X25 domain-containing protein n=1 Tax=Salpingoeca rosetta (strain ATCC 50818 / BSB-021) TaxID=946362 RepID=F2U411_SALR5|nr:uncharacterized protein PTSG_03019 [Salpingoeca rosetta]EGD82355.1 hypothetical protein PTSG_03019 [Salpingoeca rosetta]|eukprot:XP_004996538.1 hypothetical protein PTSG_03019 [Salpingoeca rosetta]
MPEWYSVAGTLIAAAGGMAWDPQDPRGRLHVVKDEHALVARFQAVPAGTYEIKVCRNGSWEQSWGRDALDQPGCPNVVIQVAETSDVCVFFDAATHIISFEVGCEVLADQPATLQVASPAKYGMGDGDDDDEEEEKDVDQDAERADTVQGEQDEDEMQHSDANDSAYSVASSSLDASVQHAQPEVTVPAVAEASCFDSVVAAIKNTCLKPILG